MKLLAAAAILAAFQEPDLEARVRAYAGRLGDERTRDRAYDRLAHLGESAIRLLEKEDVDPALLSALREETALHASLGPVYGPPRTFSFDGQEDSLGSCLARLESGSGASFHKHSIDPAARVAVKIRDASFWEALDEICRKAGVLYYPSGGEQIYLNMGAAAEKPRTFYGPLMIVLGSVIHQRRVGFDRTTTDLTVRLSCYWERHVSPLGLTRRYALSRAIDDTGQSLLRAGEPPPEPARRPGTGTRLGYDTLDLSGLRPLAAGARRLALLEGTLELEFPSRVETATFASPLDAPSASRPLEGLTAELRNCTVSSSSGMMADLALVFRDEAEAARFRPSARDADLVSSTGQKHPVYLTAGRTEKNTVTFSFRTYTGGASPDLKEIVLRVPRGSIVKKVPFRFRDVEIK